MVMIAKIVQKEKIISGQIVILGSLVAQVSIKVISKYLDVIPDYSAVLIKAV